MRGLQYLNSLWLTSALLEGASLLTEPIQPHYKAHNGTLEPSAGPTPQETGTQMQHSTGDQNPKGIIKVTEQAGPQSILLSDLPLTVRGITWGLILASDKPAKLCKTAQSPSQTG